MYSNKYVVAVGMLLSSEYLSTHIKDLMLKIDKSSVIPDCVFGSESHHMNNEFCKKELLDN